jgi:hypothetical protein
VRVNKPPWELKDVLREAGEEYTDRKELSNLYSSPHILFVVYLTTVVSSSDYIASDVWMSK